MKNPTYPTVLFTSLLLTRSLARSFVRSFFLNGTIHPSNRNNKTGKESRSPHRRESSKKTPRLAPSCLCLQASFVHISPITFQAVRAKGCEPFGCFEHTSSDTHSLPMHTVRRTRLQTGLAHRSINTHCPFPSTYLPATLPNQDTKNT